MVTLDEVKYVTTLDQKIVELMNNWQVNGWPVGNLILCVIALVLALVLCGAVGVEREWRGRSAGLRTHLLVGVGSCIIMIISLYGFPAIFGDHRDVARLAAQIITGVGFLGAGAIIHRNSGIKGLTTAGTIWIVMAIGIACGSFNFIIALVGTALIMLVLTGFKGVEIKISKKKPTITLTAPANEPILDKILTISKEFDCTVHGLSTQIIDDEGQRVIEVTYQAVFDSGESRVMEYVSKIEKETHAVNIQILGHK